MSRVPTPPTSAEPCNDPGCSRMAEWAFSVMGLHPKAVGRAVFCAYHAEFYRLQGEAVYPFSRRVPESEEEGTACTRFRHDEHCSHLHES